MKKYILILFIGLSSLFSCEFLEVDESIERSDEFVFGYFEEVKKVATQIYAKLPSDWGTIDKALRECGSDNAVHVWEDSDVIKFYNGSWSEISGIDNVWGDYYEAIRISNSFLEKFSIESFEKFEYNEDYEDDIRVAKLYPYEVRFLRAFFYFELAKRYGDIPLVTKTLTLQEANTVSKSSFDVIIQFIVDECSEIMNELPLSYVDISGKETGRITKGACMALSSRALLYAASPLFNKDNDMSKWEKAAVASWALIDSATVKNWYSLVKNEALWGSGNNLLNSKQLILEKRGANSGTSEQREAISNTFERRNTAIGFEGGNTGTCPSQNLVDAFEMKTGDKFDWSNPAHVSNPYYDAQGRPNRDPRLYMNVLNNGATWNTLKVETFDNGRNAYPLDGASKTGYYLRKYMDPDVKLAQGLEAHKPHHYILFRYAEILLNYAEAMTMWKGSAYKDATYTLSANDAINLVRSNVSMPAVSNSTIETIRNERRVELAFEDHRFWDIRRWKIGDVTKTIYGVKIMRVNGVITHSKNVVEERIWDDKMYLFPIPQSERFSNPNLTQNTGW